MCPETAKARKALSFCAPQKREILTHKNTKGADAKIRRKIKGWPRLGSKIFPREEVIIWTYISRRIIGQKMHFFLLAGQLLHKLVRPLKYGQLKIMEDTRSEKDNAQEI